MVSTRTLLCAVGIAAAASPRVALGQSPDTLRLAQVVTLARTANPMLQAARLAADAAGERVAPAGALPDPTLGFGLMNRPLGGFGTDEPMTMNAVELTQHFPWPGVLGFGKARAGHMAEAERLEADELEASLVARVKTTYFRLAFTDRAVAILTSTRGLLRDFEEVTTALYAVGEGVQQDILQAQVAVARMTADIAVMREQRTAEAARLNALLGRPATAAVGALELSPPGTAPPEVSVLIDLAAARRPALLAARERTLAAEAGYRAARRDAYPDLTLHLGYGQRPQFDDMTTIAVGVSLPLWSGSRQAPERREAEAVLAMEEARAIDLYNETFARLSELRAAAERARELSELYRTSVLPQAAAAVESALSAYRVGKVDYMTLLSNQMTVNQFEIELVRLAAEYHGIVAEIEALTGPVTEEDR